MPATIIDGTAIAYVADAIWPVPRDIGVGVGPMTVACPLRNTAARIVAAR